ncbi:3'-5' exonuclease [Wenzhouxiangella sp. XN201]|uniref:3'-5' exonuclease n=1 Tax=Wenzhouxiangella sp. XN201 TaxID=2710755 RepID=UPI0013C6ABDA|nr:3'-5' exonuclease [Wenzhouxiangella sp. XN201]NEZ04713.1 3'-5' exonuclease [Wenzhouxiangella sp. XN201]
MPSVLAEPAGLRETPERWGLAIVDVETTGLDPDHHEVIDLGAIYTDLEGNEISRFFVRIQPDHPERVSDVAKSINGFSVERWQSLDAVTPETAASRFVAFHKEVSSSRQFLFTAYNASFDRRFLNALLLRLETEFLDLYPYYTLDLPSMAFGAGSPSMINAEVAEHFDVSPETRDPLQHTGISGAEWNLALYRAMLEAGFGPASRGK